MALIYLGISGIVQEFIDENEFGTLAFTVGLREEEEGEHPFSEVQPFPSAEYSLVSPHEGGLILASTYNILQMITVNHAPVVLNASIK